ncbi:MAG: hypothetical protein HDT44_11330 [Ruminococcaceae bacterium]|nr:hypothetical protein [Oscillospiraceae bacterium]
MAVSYVARKCTQCAGKLQYIKEKKIWKCMYCGAEIEREEQYDGLFTIKNVVRQALLDTAYRRLDSAARNVVECEKIDSRYVGTLIAKIALEMIKAITPGACSANDAKNLFSQLKRDYELLKNTGDTITDEEEALYEFLEEADIYAALILVYDSLNDSARRDYVEQLLDAGKVYSKEANGNLLAYAVKSGKLDMADGIISNTNNIDVKEALSEILMKYPDGDRKSANVGKLFSTGELKNEDRAVVEKYLSDVEDSVRTKASAAVSALDSGMRISTGLIIDSVLTKADREQTEAVTSAVCKNKLSDDEVMKLVEFGLGSGDAEIAVCVLDCLSRGGQYLLIPAKLLISLLDMEAYSGEDKVQILKKFFEFKTDSKAMESAVTNYLCNNTSPISERKAVLECLFEKVTAFPTATVENYVIKTTADGEEKPGIISAMFDKGLNISFFNDLLSKYINSGADSGETRSRVIDLLSQKGLKVDPAAFIDYICGSNEELPAKLNFIKRMINNGSQLRGDAANTYLERTPPSQFSSELFSLIFSPSSTFTAKGIEKYLLEMKDREANKRANLQTIIEHSGVSLSSVRSRVVHLGNQIDCGLAQAYVLTTTDSPELAFEILDYFVTGHKIKLNSEIVVSGSSMKLKKYVLANKDRLSGVSNAICERYKVYTALF